MITTAGLNRTADDPGQCITCGAPMIITRSQNQFVCSRCDYFERTVPSNLPQPSIAAESSAPIAPIAVIIATKEPAMPKKSATKPTKPSKAAIKPTAKPAPAKRPAGELGAAAPTVAAVAAAPVPARQLAASKAKSKRGQWADDLRAILHRAVKLATRASDTFALNQHPRAEEITKLLGVAASSIEATVAHVDVWPADHAGVWPQLARTGGGGKRGLGRDAAIILRYALTNETFSLASLADHFTAYVEAPKKWPYAAEVKPESRHRWVASLASRRAVWPLVKNGLIQKISTGIYGITTAGAEIAKTAEEHAPVGAPAAKATPATKAAPTAPAKANGKAAKAPAGKAAGIAVGSKVFIDGPVPKGIAMIATPAELASLVVRSVKGKKAAVQGGGEKGVRFEVETDRLVAAS